MAAPLMQGFTMDDYVLADKLGYTREQFETMGTTGMRDMLNKRTPQKSYVQPTSVIPQVQNQQMSYNTPTGQQEDLFNLNNNEMSYNTPDGSAPGKFDLTDNYSVDQAIPINTPSLNVPSSQIGGEHQSLIDAREARTALDIQTLKDAQSFDWLGAGNVAAQGVNTIMEVGLYGDKKDYYKNVNKGLEQNLTNAQATHDNRATQQKNLGSAFSRNK